MHSNDYFESNTIANVLYIRTSAITALASPSEGQGMGEGDEEREFGGLIE